MTDPLVALERIKAEAQRRKTLAEKATRPRFSQDVEPVWKFDGNPSGAVVAGNQTIGQASGWEKADDPDHGRLAEHIAANDPATVIAACDATLATAEYLGKTLERHAAIDDEDLGFRRCSICGEGKVGWGPADVPEFEPDPWPCEDAAAALALIAQLDGGQ